MTSRETRRNRCHAPFPFAAFVASWRSTKQRVSFGFGAGTLNFEPTIRRLTPCRKSQLQFPAMAKVRPAPFSENFLTFPNFLSLQRSAALVWVLFLISSTAVGVKKDAALESVSEDELVNLVRTEKHVVVAFSIFKLQY